MSLHVASGRFTSVLNPKQIVGFVPWQDVRFSNRPFGVKRFQTIRTLGVDVARGLVLLFGIGTKALPSLILVQTKLPPRLPLI